MKFKAVLISSILALICSACDLLEENEGPLTINEIQSFSSKLKKSVTEEEADCLLKEATDRASTLGDPETLDPTSVELLPVAQWGALDKFGKRLILTQTVFNQAIMVCSRAKVSEGPLRSDEIQNFVSKMRESVGHEVADCLSKEAIARASKLGDPEALNPATVELLPADQWDALDKFGKRTILIQVVVNQSIAKCTQNNT